MKGESSKSNSHSHTLNIFRSLSLHPHPDWTTLPDQLIENVASYLTSRNDTVSFRGACNHFRKLLLPPSRRLFPHPNVKIPAPIGRTPSSRGHFLLRESTIYSVEPRTKASNELQIDAPWIVKIEEFETPGVRLKDVVSRFHFEDACNVYSNLLPNPLNLLRIRAKELTKSYHLELCVTDEKEQAPEEFDFGSNIVTYLLQKVVVSSSNDAPHVGFCVMALHDGGFLHVWRERDQTWTAIANPDAQSTFTDILYADKKFYVIDDGGRTIAVEPRELTVSEVAVAVPYVAMGSKYLVKSTNDLFMVYKYWGKNYPVVIFRENHTMYPVGLYAYILDKKTSQWVKVTNELQSRVIFVGEDASFSLSSDELPGCRGNLIYVSDIVFSRGFNSYPGWNVGVFDLDDETGNPEPISLSKNHRNMLWPPPKWLKSSSDPVPIARAQPVNPF